MALIRAFWHFLVGVKDFLVLLLMLLILFAIVAVQEEAGPAAVPRGGVLTVPLQGVLVTQRQDISPFALATGSDIANEIEAGELIAAIDAAREDDRIEALLLDFDGFLGGGLANLQGIAEALKTFRAADKPVYAYASAYFDDSYYLAAHASEVWLNPLGAVLLAGPGGSQLYFAEALEKLKVDVNVFRVGTYKSAIEPYTLRQASPEAAQARQALIDDLWTIWKEDVETARLEVAVDDYVGNLPAYTQAAGGDFAQAALARELIDNIGTRTDLGRALAANFGENENGMPGSFAGLELSDYRGALAPRLPRSGDAVGIVYVAGTIVDGEAPSGMAGSATIAGLIHEALEDDSIKALVVRIDSPGGSVTASEQIRQALLTAKAEGVPVIASMGPVAASGGYWVSTAAETVVAQPSTITGSIGVFAILPTFERTLAELGINTDRAQTTPYSGAPDLLGGLNEPTERLFQLSVEDIYRRFTSIVAEARGIAPARVDEIGQGRVWSGAAARQLQLVDRFGGLDDAIALAEQAAGYEAGELRRVDVELVPPLPLQILEDFFASEEAPAPATAADLVSQRARMQIETALADAAAIATGPAIQARCLECLTTGSPRASALRESWFTAFKALID